MDPTANPLVDTRDPAAVQAWDQVQRAQVDFALPLELIVFHTSEHWARAATVLDIGTGNGYYLASLAARFPDKTYVGIDRSAELIAIGDAARPPNVRFEHRDLADVAGQYDCALMRLFLQHQRDPRWALERAASLVRSGGAIIVFDAFDELRFFRPDVPEFQAVFRAYAEDQMVRGCDRGFAAALAAGQMVGASLKVVSRLTLIVPSTLPGNLERFRTVYGTFLDLVAASGTLDYDLAKARAEWRSWCERDDVYTQIGVAAVVLERL